jgi:hypothetical protein
MWIYEQPDWPRFRWNQDQILQPLANLRHHPLTLLVPLLGSWEGLGVGFAPCGLDLNLKNHVFHRLLSEKLTKVSR